ncbi:MAG: hypothetical protein KF826_03560 [Xanthobacteraceae bacterium]|nr:hypothetical protein [Xanthobacteraceae bacterium]MCW5676292.1 hypothetical protein [Xanthobacteraceae bacterium]
MANTANDLAKDVGLELRIIDPTEDLDAEQLEKLTRRSRMIHAELTADHSCYWDYDDIPDEVYYPLTMYLASCSGALFGKVVSDAGLDEARTREARLERLKTVAKPRFSGKKLKSDYPVGSRGRFNFSTGT